MGEKAEKAGFKKNPRVIVLICLIIFLIVIPFPFFFCLKRPLPINYEMSWVILALISMVTLEYVPFINRLRDRMKGNSKNSELSDVQRDKASWAKILLSWTSLVLFITIFALTLRILLLSISPTAANICLQIANGKNVCDNQMTSIIIGVIISDCVLISSFIIGFFMRLWLVIEANWDDYRRRTWEGVFGRRRNCGRR